MSGQVSGKGSYTGTAKATFTILKAKNTLKVRGKTVKISKKKVAKKAQVRSVTKVIKFTKKGKKSFKKKFAVNAKTDKLTVKKKLKKGTYKVRVKVTAKGTANYKAAAKTVEENNSEVPGYHLTTDSSTSGDATLAAGDEKTIALTDVYEENPTNPVDGPKGNLDITTVIRGDVSQKDVENTLKFEVTTVVTDKDGKEVTKWLDKDGNLVDEKTEFTLKDGFVTNDGGKTYTKRFKGVPIGKYTIKETETNIDGFEFQDGNSVIISDAEVVENETAQLNLEGEYARTNPDEEVSEQTEDQPAAQTTEPPTKTSKDSQSKEKSDRSAGTGDDASLGMMIALMLASLAGIVGVAIHSRRRRDAR